MTKFIIALAAGLLLTTGAASASNTFALSGAQDSQTLIELGTVVADRNGVVEVYDYRTGTEGRLLGSEAVKAGANTNIKISLASLYTDEVLAVLVVDGQVVARQIVRINN